MPVGELDVYQRATPGARTVLIALPSASARGHLPGMVTHPKVAGESSNLVNRVSSEAYGTTGEEASQGPALAHYETPTAL